MVERKKLLTFAPLLEGSGIKLGALAQLVEHRTENPCVPGSIPGGTTPPFIMNPVKTSVGAGFFQLKALNELKQPKL